MIKDKGALYFGQILRKYRKKQNLRQREVALIFKYTSAQFVSNWERGLCYPPVSAFGILAHTYGIPKAKLIELYLESLRVTLEETIQIPKK